MLATVFFLQACGGSDGPQDTPIDPQDAFFDTVSALCGMTFAGEGVYPDPDENPDHPLLNTELRNHISVCEEDMVRIELLRDGGNYWHGAWVLEKREDGLHLFHDHLGDVRTEEDLGEGDYHGYGGYANDEGSANRQYFPADEVTAEIIPAAATNVWMMDVNLSDQVFTYYLERHGEPRFRAEVDLSQTVE